MLSDRGKGASSSWRRQLRRWPVNGFENWLIFYRAKCDAVDIVHVLHGAQDIERCTILQALTTL
jgi:plasmid stabilization system protein ParE